MAAKGSRVKGAEKKAKRAGAKKRVRAPGRPVSSRFTRISARQLSLPAGFSADGSSMVPLRDVLSPHVPTMELTQLSQTQQADLTAERIRRQKRYKMGMFGL